MTETEQIEAIYHQYPRQVGRRAALKAVENAVKRIVGTVILDHGTPKERPCDPLTARRLLYKRTAEYAESPAGQKSQDPDHDYRPHPATFFNQDRFFDDPAEWQKPNGSRNGKHATTTADSETIARANAKIAELGGNHLRAR